MQFTSFSLLTFAAAAAAQSSMSTIFVSNDNPYTAFIGTSAIPGCPTALDEKRVECFWSKAGFNSPAASYLANQVTNNQVVVGLVGIKTAVTDGSASNVVGAFSAYSAAVGTVNPDAVPTAIKPLISSVINQALALQNGQAVAAATTGSGSAASSGPAVTGSAASSAAASGSAAANSAGAASSSGSGAAASSSTRSAAAAPKQTGLAMGAAGIAIGLAGLAIGL